MANFFPTNFYVFTNENNKEHSLKWPYIQEHPHRPLIIGASGSGKTNVLFNLINEKNRDKPNAIKKIYLYAKDLNEPKYLKENI